MLIYFLADRPPGVKDVMYAPGLTNSDASQREMVAELDESKTEYAILAVPLSYTFDDTNESRIPGSTILDTYLASEFTQVFGGDQVLVLERRPPPIAP